MFGAGEPKRTKNSHGIKSYCVSVNVLVLMFYFNNATMTCMTAATGGACIHLHRKMKLQLNLNLSCQSNIYFTFFRHTAWQWKVVKCKKHMPLAFGLGWVWVTLTLTLAKKVLSKEGNNMLTWSKRLQSPTFTVLSHSLLPVLKTRLSASSSLVEERFSVNATNVCHSLM